MPTRRNFLKSAVIAASLDVGNQVARASARSSNSDVRYVLFDEDAPLASAFIKAGNSAGARVIGYSGDVALPWFASLRPRLSQNSATFAGISSQGALFCLERWAWDLDMRVVHRLDYAEDENGKCRHISGYALPASIIEGLDSADDLIGLRAANLAISGHHFWQPSANLPPAKGLGPTGKMWVSWTIAPKNITGRAV